MQLRATDALLWRLVSGQLINVWHPEAGRGVPPFKGVPFDSGGVLWPTAIWGQTIVLQISQLTLAAILALNQCYVSSVLILLLLLFTGRRHAQMARYYAPLAATLPLQQAKALDGALWAVAAGEKRMAAAGPGRGAMPEELLRALSEAEASYQASAEGRAAGAS